MVDWLIVVRREDIRDDQIFDNMKIVFHYPTKYYVKAIFLLKMIFAKFLKQEDHCMGQ